MLREEKLLQNLRLYNGKPVALQINGNSDTESSSYILSLNSDPSNKYLRFTRKIDAKHEEQINIAAQDISDLVDIVELGNKFVVKEIGYEKKVVPIIRIIVPNAYITQHKRIDTPHEYSQVHVG